MSRLYGEPHRALQDRFQSRAMADRIEQYDSTGVIPEYFIFLDQNYFEINGTRRWFRILEDPLREELDLPDGYDAWEAEHAAMRARLKRGAKAWLSRWGVGRQGQAT